MAEAKTHDIGSAGGQARLDRDEPARTKRIRPASFRELWERHHLAAAVVGCTLFLVAGGIAQAMGAWTGLIVGFYVLAYVSGGIFSLRDGISSLVNERRIDVDLLMVMAAVAAASIGEWIEGGILLFLFSLSNALQFYAMDRTRRAITALMSMRPQEALLKKDDGHTELVPIDALHVGDVIIVRPGELVPIDGVIVSGTSTLDQASITGESIPVAKGEGDEVFGGTINQNGVLEVRMTKLPEETVIAKIIRMVEEAQSEEAPTQRRIDTIEQYYAVGVIVLTILTGAIPIMLGYDRADSIYRAITLMVVASPCAVAMAVPAPVVASIARAARAGILFKGGVHIENMAEVKVVAFDKTGTLTEGKPKVADVIPLGGRDRSEVLNLAASVEIHSEHPLANAIIECASHEGIDLVEPSGTQAIPGHGIVADIAGEQVWVGNARLLQQRVDPEQFDDVVSQGNQLEDEGKTVMYVGQSAQVIGIISVTDRLRPGVEQTIRGLKDRGVEKIVMLTGDNRQVAEAIGKQVGVDEVYAQLLPDQKAEIVSQLRESIGPIAMVGDGVNDAPALARATIGVAMGAAGTDVALETADVVLMSNDLSKINQAVALCRKSKSVIWQNIIFSLAVIAVLALLVLTKGIILAAGVIGHEGSTILVIFNSLRLLVTRVHADESISAA